MALALTKNSHRGYSMPSAMADISMTYGWDISSEITRCDTHAHTHTQTARMNDKKWTKHFCNQAAKKKWLMFPPCVDASAGSDVAPLEELKGQVQHQRNGTHFETPCFRPVLYSCNY